MPSKLFRYWWLTLIAQLPFIKSSPTSSFRLAKPFSVLNFRKKLENASSSGPFYSPKGWLFCMKRCHLPLRFCISAAHHNTAAKNSYTCGHKEDMKRNPSSAAVSHLWLPWHQGFITINNINAPQGLPKFPYHTRYQFLKSCWKLASNSLNNHLS